MLDVMVKTKDVRLSIPVPYAFLNLGVLILSSNTLYRIINNLLKEHLKGQKISLTIPPIDKKALKPIVNELKRHKGMVLVHVNSQDGSEIKIKL